MEGAGAGGAGASASKKMIRLKGCHGKYLWAEDDLVTVSQDRDGSSEMAVWSIEEVPGSSNRLRLRSCYGYYLTASAVPSMPGLSSGKKVLQSGPSKLDGSVEWELLIVDEQTIKLKNGGNTLHANSGLPPWRSSVTHDDFCDEWSSWKVEIVEQRPPDKLELARRTAAPLYDGRIVFYIVAESELEASDECCQWHYVFFRGRSTEKLARRLRKEVEVDASGQEIKVCVRLQAAGSVKLCPVHLELPPGSSPIYLVVLKRHI